jgi:hypothetical protein
LTVEADPAIVRARQDLRRAPPASLRHPPEDHVMSDDPVVLELFTDYV